MKLGKLCKTQYGTSAATTSDGEQHVLGMSNIGDGRVDLAGLSRLSLSEREASTLRLHKYDVLFNRTNSRALVGKVGILMEEPETPTVFASYLVRLIPNERVRPQWLAYAMSSGITGRSIVRLITLGVSQANINPSELLKWVAIPVPPIEVQDHLIDRFGDFDNAADKLRYHIEFAKHRLHGLMQQLLTGRRRLPAFAGEAWEEVPFGDLLDQVDRYVEWSDDEVYRLVSVRRRSGGFFDRERKPGSEILTKTLKTTRTGDFVIAKMQVLHGAMTVTPPEFDGSHVSDSYLTFVPKDQARLHMPFLGWLSKTPRMYYKAFRSSYGVAIEKMTFHLPWFMQETISLPTSIDEQRAIADILDTAQREIELLEQLREQIQLQKRGLMQKLLTGEIRVPGDEPVAEEVST